jgi:hypothetical protein
MRSPRCLLPAATLAVAFQSFIVMVSVALAIGVSASRAHADWNPGGVDVGLRAQDRVPRVTVVHGSQGDWYVVGMDDGVVKVLRYDSGGNPLWAGPVTFGTSQDAPFATADGAGGLYVAQIDSGTHLVRIAPSGTVVPPWPAGGVDTQVGFEPVLWPDESGGVFETGSGPTVARVAGDGTVVSGWPIQLLQTAYYTGLVPDGSGGLYIAAGQAGAAAAYAGLVVFRIGPNGLADPAWPVAGRVIDPNADWVGRPAMLALPGGDVMIAWRRTAWTWDQRTQTFAGMSFPACSLFVQRLTPTGAVATGWPANGVLIDHPDSLRGSTPELVDDSHGGAFVLWAKLLEEVELTTTPMLLAKHVLGDGTFATGWPDSGRVMLTPPATLAPMGDVDTPNWIGDRDEFRPRQGFTSCSDGAGGGFVAWADYRSYPPLTVSPVELRVLRFGATGMPAAGWPADGALGARSGAGGQPQSIAPDGAGGVVVAWDSLECMCCNGGCTPHIIGHARFNRVGPNGVVAALASLASASIAGGVAHLTWLVTGNGSRFTIERRADAGAWTRLADAIADGRGFVSYDDPVPADAASLAYRLAWTENGTTITAGEVTLAVPHGVRFALESLAPNPAREALTVRFALRPGPPATLELMDIAGRRVRLEALEAGSGGERLLRLDGLDALPAGIYLARLSQGSERAFARVAVVR